MRGTRLRLAAFAAVLGLALTACGGGGGAPPTVSMPRTPADPPPAETPAPRVWTVAAHDRTFAVDTERTLRAAGDAAGTLPRLDSGLNTITQSTNAGGGIATDGAWADFDADAQRLSVRVVRQGETSLVLDSNDAYLDSGPDLEAIGTRIWNTASGTDSATTLSEITVGWFAEDRSISERLRDDWIADGYWLHFAGQNLLSTAPTVTVAEMGAFIDGPRYRFPPARLPTGITARYQGNASGFFTLQYGTGRGIAQGRPQGTAVGGNWFGTATLTADFADNSISGCIGCTGDIRLTEWLVPSGVQRLPANTPATTRIHLGRARIDTDGRFRSATVTLSDSGTAPPTSSSGSWGGKFSNILLPLGGEPLSAGGTVGSQAVWSDGSAARYIGTFHASHRD